eukprot:TRINITY_DN12387_c0_g1_i1.p1 TRINITY_DN12387_c0_g1~~TRINITY_DN12387_c0_g1_i1.p1  ORF type:complete len:442 (-),score=138.55 TRINITY_DN12387_c0_g1_i1:86-1372(-)
MSAEDVVMTTNSNDAASAPVVPIVVEEGDDEYDGDVSSQKLLEQVLQSGIDPLAARGSINGPNNTSSSSSTSPSAGLSSAPMVVEPEEQKMCDLQVKWNKNTYSLQVPTNSTILNVKRMLYERTKVLPVRQKLVGLKLEKNKGIVSDDTVVGELNFKKELKFVMIGTPEEKIFVYEEEKDSSADLVNDLDYDYSSLAVDSEQYFENLLAADPNILVKLEQVIATSEVALINPPRKGKKLLVLDLDYTLFDMKSTSASGNLTELKRPFTDELLKAVYPYYDIVVWSQTSWRWLEIKLTELGMLTHPDYKITFVLDKTTMFTVEGARVSRSTGKRKDHQVKPLELIWRKFADYYSAKQTIHIDDLSRNFALNPKNGLKIRAFKNAEEMRHTDCELLLLTRYLLLISELEDFSKLSHKHWKRYIQDHGFQQ